MRELAQSTYETRSRASPLERLSVVPPVEGELEQGKWSRVNARASTMIMASLDATVSSEMVARRLTKSSPGLVFRLLTLYQPGGEQEKGSSITSAGQYRARSRGCSESVGKVAPKE